jgi:type I restriction enzyme R subunit
LRRGITSPILDSVLIDQLQRLNPATVDRQHAEDVAKKLVRVRANVEGNLDAWEYLKGLKPVFVEAERQERNIRLLDSSNVGKNKFHVTDEFTFSNGTPPDIRTDIMFFINGVPIIVKETKAALHMEGTAEAFQEFPHWQTSSHQEQEVRKSLYKALIESGVEAVVDLAQGVMKMLRRASL